MKWFEKSIIIFILFDTLLSEKISRQYAAHLEKAFRPFIRF